MVLLCNSLYQQGCGPFSHVFDQFFIPEVRPDTKWKVSVIIVVVLIGMD